jgi:hypothetical protein
MLQMNSMALNNGAPTVGGATLTYGGGAEFSMLMTFMLPAVPLSMTDANSALTLLSTTSALSGGRTFGVTVNAVSTGVNSGIVYAMFVCGTPSNNIALATPPMVAVPMLFGGWVTVAFSVSAAGVATLSVRDIFAANNATSTGAHRQMHVVCWVCWAVVI